MDRRHFLSVLSIGTVASAFPHSVIAGPAGCASVEGAFWQLTYTDQDLPYINYTSIRLDDQNHVMMARWNNQRVLSGVSAVTSIDADQAGTFRELATRKSSFLSGIFGKKNNNPSQPSGGVEGAVADQNKTRSHSVGSDVQAYSEFLAQMQTSLPMRRPDPGKYIWTKYLSGADQIDVNLRDGCEDEFARAVSESLQSVSIIAPVSQGYEKYFEGELSARFEFGVRMSKGFAGYGVLQA